MPRLRGAIGARAELNGSPVRHLQGSSYADNFQGCTAPLCRWCHQCRHDSSPWIGAHWATRLKSKTLYRVIAVLLVLIAALLFVTHFFTVGPLNVPAGPRTMLGIAAGVIIGVVAALMGVAGGELLIPTIVLLYGTDIKIAGSLSLAVSLPTMLVAFGRFSRDESFSVLGQNKPFLVAMTLGSITGTVIGGLLLGVVPSLVLIPLLVLLPLLSSVKVWNHEQKPNVPSRRPAGPVRA